MDAVQRDLQHRVMAHMLPACAAQGLTIPQHKAICAAVIELIGAELSSMAGDVFREMARETDISDGDPLPASLSSVQRHEDAEAGVV